MIFFWRKKLLYQVYTLIITIMAMMMLVIGYLVLQEQKRTILDVMRTQAQTLAKSIELVSADAMVTDDQSFLVEHNLNVLAHSPAIRFIIISKNNGEALMTRKDEWQLMGSVPQNVKHLEGSSEHQTIILNPYVQGAEKIYYYTYPLNFDGISWGWIHLGFSLESLNHAYDAIYSEILLIFLIVFIVLTISIFFLSRYIVGPIIALSHATKKMAQGDMEVTFYSSRKDEIGELTNNFNAMAQSLLKSQNELKNSNALLEQKVEERTRALEEINKTLDERVQHEILIRREQEQILIQQSRFAAMGEMIGNIAHQWRQPLNALSLLLQNVIFAYETGNLDKKLMDRVSTKGNLLISNMSTTIDDFRNFFKPNRIKAPFNIGEQLSKTLQMLQASLTEHQVSVECDIKEGLNVEGFGNEFSQVLLNIINNAKDALEERPIINKLIRIKGYCSGNDIIIEISDNAGGIPDDIMDKVFDPYFTTKEEGKGTGIGLYMSKVIIENNMQGKLSVQNSGEGALFTITLANG
jgi:two-component system, NtrC family, sensor kinase